MASSPKLLFDLKLRRPHSVEVSSSTPAPTSDVFIQLVHHLKAGSFFKLDEGTVLFVVDMMPQKIYVGEALPLSCMFDINILLARTEEGEDTHVGYLFNTQFYCKTEGGYYVA